MTPMQCMEAFAERLLYFNEPGPKVSTPLDGRCVRFVPC